MLQHLVHNQRDDVVPAQRRIALTRKLYEFGPLDVHNGHTKRAASKIVHHDGLLLDNRSICICKSSRGWFC